MADSYTYLSCLKCDSLVFNSFTEIHDIECHQSSVNYTHPFIKFKECIMAAHMMQLEEGLVIAPKILTIIESESVKGNLKSLAFVNERDFKICDFTIFSMIIISDGDVEAFFIPVSCEGIPPMTVILFENGHQKFRKYEKTSLLHLRNLNMVNFPSEVYFTVKSSLNELNPFYIEELINSINLKFPYLLKKGDELNFLGSVTVTVADIKGNSDNSDVNKFMLPIQKVYYSIQFISSEDWKNSQIDWSQKYDLLEITSNFKDIDLNQGTKQNKVLASSSPLSQSSKANNLRKKRRKSKVNSCNVISNSSLSEEIPLCSKYYKLGAGTKCYVIDEKLLSSKNNVISESSYYQDQTYSIITKCILKKLQLNNGLKFSLSNLWSGILLTGYSGTGKTTLVHKLSSNLNLTLVVVSLLEWAKSSLSESEFMLQSFSKAKEKAPSILFFDEIDSLCFQKTKTNEGFASLIIKIIKEAKKLNKSIILISASNRPEEIPSKLLECGRFDKEFILTLPDVCKKASILWYLISAHDNILTREEVNEIAKLTRGFSAADLKSLIKTALHFSLIKWKTSYIKSESPILTFCDFKKSISSIVPSFLRQNYTTVKEVYWHDIFGYENMKKQIQEMLVNKSNVSYELKGLLLFGPPGCSKTMFVRAIATETRFTFFPVKCSDLLSKYVGETERSLCSLFRRASMSAPSLIFMDEIDSICGERSGQGCLESVVVTELLSLIQRATKRGDVMIIGATNRPQAVDESLLSPGCFESLLYIDLPNCHSRCSMWKSLLNEVPAANIDIQYLCEKTKGFSGAEIIDVYQKTAQTLMVNYMENKNVDVDDVIFTQQDFLMTLENVQPRTSSAVFDANKIFYDMRKGSIINK